SLVFEDGSVVGIQGRSRSGSVVTERARITIGADGRNSVVAGVVRAPEYNQKPQLLAAYYSYWSGIPTDGRFETYIRPYRGCAAVQTHDNLTLIIAGWPYSEFEANKTDVEGNYMKVLELAPQLADRVRRGKREAPFAGAALPNFFRKPYGAG